MMCPPFLGHSCLVLDISLSGVLHEDLLANNFLSILLHFPFELGQLLSIKYKTVILIRAKQDVCQEIQYATECKCKQYNAKYSKCGPFILA